MLDAQGNVRVRSWLAVLTVVLTLVATGCTATTAPDSPPSQSTTPSEPIEFTDNAELREVVPGLLSNQGPFAQVSVPGNKPAGQDVTISVDTSVAAISKWQPTNVGLSFELRELADPRWEPDASSLDGLVGALDGAALRFGGKSADRNVWFTDSNEPAPQWARATLTPADFERLGRFAEAANAQVSLVVDLGHSDPKRSAAMALAAYNALGERLVAVSIGNEPNGYTIKDRNGTSVRDSSWDRDAYREQVTEFATVIHQSAPNLPIAGPGAFDKAWWEAFIEADIPNTVAMTQHWYPLWSCPGKSSAGDAEAEPTVANLMSASTHERASRVFDKAYQVARAAGLALWMEETGPTSCSGGNETSRTHAQSLWTVDYVLNGAMHGVERMALHSMIDACQGGAPMSAVCHDGKLGEQDPDVFGEVGYLGLLFASQLSAGELIPVMVSGSDQVYAYAVRHTEGLDVVVINRQDPQTVGAAALDITLNSDARVVAASQLGGATFAQKGATQLVPLRQASAESVATIAPGSALLIRYAN